ncbi:hypothetical protein M422DRAFT_63246 [Sphaerobolus stellatus SS14]|nr:hypothetical protein M422DRAFT_63246 [Sphaerobolus stellatus SS14]
MSNMFQNIKDKIKQPHAGEREESGEQRFSIQPHPAKTNDPSDLQRDPPQPGAGLNSKPEIAAHYAHGPQILTKEAADSLGPAASPEELRRRQEELNRPRQ